MILERAQCTIQDMLDDNIIALNSTRFSSNPDRRLSQSMDLLFIFESLFI